MLAVEAPDALYAKRGVTKDTHLLLSFDRLRTFGPNGQEAMAKINGMSGCGVWRRRLLGPDAITALLTEHHQKEGKFIVATRLTTIIPALSKYVADRQSAESLRPAEPAEGGDEQAASVQNA